jgi:hypothetical protein
MNNALAKEKRDSEDSDAQRKQSGGDENYLGT